MTIALQKILNELDKEYPFRYQEDWDNSGLLTGSPKQNVQKILLALEPTLETIQEAVKVQADLIITHHPMLFRPVKTLTDPLLNDKLSLLYKNDIAYLAMHTNADKASNGLNWFLGKKLGLDNINGLFQEKEPVKRKKITALVCVTTRESLIKLQEKQPQSVYRIRFSGIQTASDNRNIYDSQPSNRDFYQAEIITSLQSVAQVLNLLKEGSDRLFAMEEIEEPAAKYGLGIRGSFQEPLDWADFLKTLRNAIGYEGAFRTVRNHLKKVKKIELCTGSGSSMIGRLRDQEAVFITGDLTYHHAVLAQEKGFCIVDAGHFFTENIFTELIKDFLGKTYPELEIHTYNGRKPWEDE